MKHDCLSLAMCNLYRFKAMVYIASEGHGLDACCVEPKNAFLKI
jgi:hypothetical protein